MEVVVVADGCTDDTIKMLQAYEAPFTLRFIEQSGQGPAIARNEGAAKATGTLLMFLDDDIEASPQMVEAHVRAHHQPNQVAIGYLPPLLQNQSSFFHIKLQGWWEEKFQQMRRIGHHHTYQDLLSGNFSIAADLFNHVGGFDPTLRCREDYELGARLIKTGAQFTFVPDAWGYHRDEVTNLDRSLRRKRQEGRADVQLGYRHPELRQALHLVYFETPASWLESLLLFFVFTWPVASGFLAMGVRRVLDILEWLRMHGYWQQLNNRLHGYWYLRGVIDELPTRKALSSYLQGGPIRPEEGGLEIEVDLREGLAVAEQQLDEKRPLSVRIRYGQQPIGRLLPQSCAERFRGVHLRPALATNLSWSLLIAMALESVPDIALSSECQLAELSVPTLENVHAY
jgi:glycosyltransferase involved in cell wall biosynthesis